MDSTSMDQREENARESSSKKRVIDADSVKCPSRPRERVMNNNADTVPQQIPTLCRSVFPGSR